MEKNSIRGKILNIVITVLTAINHLQSHFLHRCIALPILTICLSVNLESLKVEPHKNLPIMPKRASWEDLFITRILVTDLFCILNSAFIKKLLDILITSRTREKINQLVIISK